jgi:toxin ParE1/3/4
MNILWTAPAEADLDGIFDHILANNPQAALSVYERLRERVGRLTSFPYTGRPGRLHDTRELIIPDTPHIVVYRVRPAMIEVLRVIHGAMLWPPEGY